MASTGSWWWGGGGGVGGSEGGGKGGGGTGGGGQRFKEVGWKAVCVYLCGGEHWGVSPAVNAFMSQQVGRVGGGD